MKICPPPRLAGVRGCVEISYWEMAYSSTLCPFSQKNCNSGAAPTLEKIILRKDPIFCQDQGFAGMAPPKVAEEGRNLA